MQSPVESQKTPKVILTSNDLRSRHQGCCPNFTEHLWDV